MPTHESLGLDDREDVEDRREPSIKLDEEEAVAVRKRYSAFHLPLHHNQLLPERSVLGLKLAL